MTVAAAAPASGHCSAICHVHVTTTARLARKESQKGSASICLCTGAGNWERSLEEPACAQADREVPHDLEALLAHEVSVDDPLWRAGLLDAHASIYIDTQGRYSRLRLNLWMANRVALQKVLAAHPGGCIISGAHSGRTEGRFSKVGLQGMMLPDLHSAWIRIRTSRGQKEQH